MAKRWESRVPGPLAPYAGGFRSQLARLRYSLGGTEYQMWIMFQLNQWLVTHGLGLTDFTPDRVEQFVAAHRNRRGRRFATERAMHPLFGYLRDRGVLPPPASSPPNSEADELLKHYRGYLIECRDLAPRTIEHYECMARGFLRDCLTPLASVVNLRGLTVADVARFLLRKTSCRTARSVRNDVTWLRPFLRFLYVEDITPSQLAVSLPPAAGWRQTQLPARLTPGEVEALLASCNRSEARGHRDFAILILLARLGLRCIEVARLELGDFNWRAGEVLIRGKGLQTDPLPIPVDVGEAIVAYLRDGRPQTELRHVFITHRAPLRGIGTDVVSNAVRDACRRVGIPAVGAHRLRHTLASEMLRQGLALPEIAQVLRHRDLSSTAIYAKVDRMALMSVVQQWPEGGR